MSGRAYLDWNATAPLRPEARAAMADAFDVVGNPSSVHAEGRRAKAVVDRARDAVAALVGCRPGEVIFTSGATEGAGILSHLGAEGGVVVDETAHDCLWAHAGPAGGDGATLAMGLANSETGALTEPPAAEEGGWRAGGGTAARLFLDVVQAVGRVPFAFAWSGADYAVLSAHKIGGPKGVGALIVRQGLDIPPLARGGGQEMGRRSGTENVAGIAGFGAAAEAALAELEAGVWARVAGMRDELEQRLTTEAPSTIFVGRDEPRIPNTTCFATPGWKGETQVMQMDLAGFAVSAGSACSSGKVKTSRVLKAHGLDETAAASAIRVSLGPTTREEEVRRFADAWLAAHEKFRRKAA